MKYLIRRLLAGWLSAAMLFSAAGVMPFASAYQAEQRAEGGVTNEGAKPTGTVNIVLPTDAASKGLFNMILDPKDNLRTTNGERFEDSNITAESFGPGNLFFKNTAQDGKITFSRSSDPLTIKNTGSTPVLVDMSVEVHGTPPFQFANSADFEDLEGNTIEGPAMYLALVTGRRSAPVLTRDVETEVQAVDEDGTPEVDDDGEPVMEMQVEKKNTAFLKGWIERPKVYELHWVAADEKYDYVLKPGTLDSEFPTLDFFMTGAINDDTWDVIPQSEVDFTITWQAKGEIGPEENPYPADPLDPSIKVTAIPTTVGSKATLKADFGEGDLKKDKITGMKYLKSGAEEYTTVKAGATNFKVNGTTLTVKAVADIYNGSNWRVVFTDEKGKEPIEIPFDLFTLSPDDPVIVVPKNPSYTMTYKVMDVGETATLTVYFGKGRLAMSTVDRFEYTTKTGDNITLHPGEEGFTVSGTNVSIPVVKSLYLGKDWKLILSNEDDEYFTLNLDDLKDPNAASYVDENPTVTMTAQASYPNEEAKATITWGKGDLAVTRLARLEYKTSAGKSASLSLGSEGFKLDGNEVTIKASMALYVGSDWKLVFLNDIGETVRLSVDLLTEDHYIVEDITPSVSVLSAAHDFDDTVTMSADFGKGDTERSRISAFTYTRKGETITLLPGDENFTVNGTDLTLKAVWSVYTGEDWTVTFTDDKGGNAFECGVNIKADDAELRHDREPGVEVTHQAEVLEDTVVMTVDYGMGDYARAKVDRFEYVSKKHGDTTINVGNGLTVGGFVAEIVAVRDIYTGSDWKLIFTDADGGNEFVVDVDLLAEDHEEVVDANPSITAYESKAAKVDEETKFTISFGQGELEMTKLARLEYLNSKGQTKVVTAGREGFTVEGKSVVIKAVSALYGGSDWNLIFTREEDEETCAVAVELLADEHEPLEEESIEPSVTVKQGAKQPSDFATMILDLGSGDAAVAGFKNFVFTRDTGSTLKLPSTNANVTLEGDVLTIKAVAMLYNGSNWGVEFEDDAGETSIIYFDLKHETHDPNESGDDPAATVTTPATAAGQWVELTLSKGTGDKKVSSIKRFLFTRGDTSVDFALVLPNAAVQIVEETDDSITVRIRAVAMIYNGSNWRFEMEDEDGNIRDTAVFDIKEAG